ncbi:MAG: Asp-tRNA(Asn)/Glu-tRNA(Gln) amidotransferase subunit GatB [Dehalococcoidia bacterium]|nr:Asp-tRNA(Asn)/Glu-tRNA(Gln) amidotransferase subunit GatB [Dehalococcoidia bacterium]
MTTTTAVRYEVVIGLEVHSQLLTASKMFCSCSAAYAYAPPNTHVCPVCFGMPGVLPVINRRAVELTVLTGLALNCKVPASAKFDRKNYPYPDLMKGYQISQFDMPLCVDGWLEVEVGGEARRLGITRVHLEEDTARLLHREANGEGYSLLDVNRAGAPLMEIVSEPDMRSPEEAREYLVRLRQILQYIGVSAGNMEEGNFRCDANVSLRRFGASELGAKVEVKNMNSFRSVFRALEYEVERQTAILDSGERIAQETRGWVDGEAKTVSQRSKEQAHDYRYFPEPDLPPLALSREFVEGVRALLPELPVERRARLQDQFGLGLYEANLLTENRAAADYFETAVNSEPAGRAHGRAQGVANWMLGDFTHALGDQQFANSKVAPAQLAALVDLQDSGQVTSKIAKSVFRLMYESGGNPAAIIKDEGLAPISGGAELEEAALRVINGNEKAVSDYRAGKETVIRFLVGQLMKETRGRANPQEAESALLAALSTKNGATP